MAADNAACGHSVNRALARRPALTHPASRQPTLPLSHPRSLNLIGRRHDGLSKVDAPVVGMLVALPWTLFILVVALRHRHRATRISPPRTIISGEPNVELLHDPAGCFDVTAVQRYCDLLLRAQ